MRAQSSRQEHAVLVREISENMQAQLLTEAARSSHTAPIRLSRSAQVFRKMIHAPEQTPDIRQQQINAVQEKIKSGQYRVDAEHLVQLILEAAEDMRSYYKMAA